MGNGTLDLYYSTDEGLSWYVIPYNAGTPTNPFTLTTAWTRYTAWLDVLSTKIRLRFRNSNSGEYFEFRGMNLWGQMREYAHK